MARAMEYDFVHSLNKDYNCAICLGLANDPKQCQECGHLFCSRCITNHGNNPCPLCRDKSPQFFKDKKSKRDIEDLAVRCPNKEAGCQWIGTVGTHKDHQNACSFALVPCTNECEGDKEDGEVRKLMRKDLENHLAEECLKRQIECPNCKVSYEVTEDHELTCGKVKITCPNETHGCSVVMERSEMSQHVSTECPYSSVPCKYRNLGCRKMMLRKHLNAHIRKARDAHIDLMMANSSDGPQPTKAQIVFKVPDYAKLKEDKGTFQSRPLYTAEGYKMRFCVNANGKGRGEDTHVYIGMEMLQGDKTYQLKSDLYQSDDINWPFRGSITYELLNQLADCNHFEYTDVIDAELNIKVKDARGSCKFISHDSLQHNPSTNTQYLLDDTLYVRVDVTVDADKPWLRCKNTFY